MDRLGNKHHRMYGVNILVLQMYVPLILTNHCYIIPGWKTQTELHFDVWVVCALVMMCSEQSCLSAPQTVKLFSFFFSPTLNYHKHTRLYSRYTGNFQQCKQPCVVDVWDWLREKQSCLKSHLGWEAAHMESYQIVLILLIGCSTLNRSSC